MKTDLDLWRFRHLTWTYSTLKADYQYWGWKNRSSYHLHSPIIFRTLLSHYNTFILQRYALLSKQAMFLFILCKGSLSLELFYLFPLNTSLLLHLTYLLLFPRFSCHQINPTMGSYIISHLILQENKAGCVLIKVSEARYPSSTLTSSMRLSLCFNNYIWDN